MRKRDCALIFLLTALLIRPLFGIEYLNNWASIEATFIAGARYLLERWPHPQWQPDWYLGTRWDYVYPPGIHYGPAILAKLLGVSAARGYHIYVALLYCFGVAGVYAFVATAMRSRRWAWIAAAACATLSPAYLLMEHMRLDSAGSRYWPMRLNVLIRYGEGPHMSAFAWIPWALAAAWIGLRPGRDRHLGLAAPCCAMVATNNFYGATALATFFPIAVWAVFVETRDWRVFPRSFAIAALAYGLTAVWLVPSYVAITARNMALVSNPGNLWSVWLALGVTAAIAALTWRFTRDAWIVFVAGSSALFSLNVLGNRWIGFRISGEPERLVPELDLVLILLAVAVCAWMWRRGWIAKFAVVALLFWSITVCKGWVRRAHTFYSGDAKYAERIEYKMQDWIARNLPDRRVLVTGSIRFWFNVWQSQAQAGGGSEQGVLNMNTVYSYYAAVTDTSPDFVAAWMQAVGVSAISVNGKASKEIYHDWENPERFIGKLKALYDDGKDNWVYEIPRRFPELARVVDAAAIRANGPAYVAGKGEAPLRSYVALIEAGPDRRVSVERPAPEHFRLTASLQPGDAIVVQESWDAPWRAFDNGREIRVEPDPAGFMLIDPGSGERRIELRWETPLENRVGRAVTIASILVLLWLLAARRSSPLSASSS